MPQLYCANDGREREEEIYVHRQIYRQESETALVMKGRLISGPWVCDHCNRRLRKGALACLVSVYPRWVREATYDYDFDYEAGYFDVAKAELTVYGDPWALLEEGQGPIAQCREVA